MAEAHGPIDFLILEFPTGTDGEATAAALADLVDRGFVRLFDLLAVRKDDDGACREVDLAADADAGPAALTAFVGARSGLLGDDDVLQAANALEPGTSAIVLVYENRWAVPFVAAARAEGVEVVASARLSAQQIMDALDALETAS
jgi:uncharacterized membrane protein